VSNGKAEATDNDLRQALSSDNKGMFFGGQEVKISWELFHILWDHYKDSSYLCIQFIIIHLFTILIWDFLWREFPSEYFNGFTFIPILEKALNITF